MNNYLDNLFYVVIVNKNLPYTVQLGYIWSHHHSLDKYKYNYLWSQVQVRYRRVRIELPKIIRTK